MSKELKKQIIFDWHKVFPALTIYSTNRLYKVLGCLVIGIELIKLPRVEKYRPHFVLYPLWKKNIKECLENPIMLGEFYNEKGLQFDIPYEKHAVYFKSTVESVKRQLPLSFEGDILVKEINTVLEKYTQTPPLNAVSNSYLQAKLKEMKLLINLYNNNVDEIQNIVQQIQTVNWDTNNFNYFGFNDYDWLNDLQNKINKRSDFLEQIHLNEKDKKIEQMKKSNII
jgi:hypothetical protein